MTKACLTQISWNLFKEDISLWNKVLRGKYGSVMLKMEVLKLSNMTLACGKLWFIQGLLLIVNLYGWLEMAKPLKLGMTVGLLQGLG